MFYDVIKLALLFLSLYVLRFGPNRYSVILQKYKRLTKIMEEKKLTEERYSIVLQFSEQDKDSFKKDPEQDKELIDSISGYFSEKDSLAIID